MNSRAIIFTCVHMQSYSHRLIKMNRSISYILKKYVLIAVKVYLKQRNSRLYQREHHKNDQLLNKLVTEYTLNCVLPRVGKPA